MAAVLLIPAGTVTVSAGDFGAVGSRRTRRALLDGDRSLPELIAKGAAFAASGAEVEGQTYSCGVVVVPEDHAKPDGRTIELFYLKLHSSSQSPAPDPLVYLAGGPGSSGSYEVTLEPDLVPEPEPDPRAPGHHRLRPARHRLLQLPAVRAVRVGHRHPPGPRQEPGDRHDAQGPPGARIWASATTRCAPTCAAS